MKSEFYDRALARITHLTAALGVAGAITALIWRGAGAGAGFAIGATLSFLNLRWWSGVAGAIGTSGKVPLRGSAALLGLRYLLAGAAIYVIVKFLEISLVAVLAGLFVCVAAVIVEMFYELIFSP